MSRDTEQARN